MENKSCETNLISFSDKMTNLVITGNTVDVIYLDFYKAFDIVPHNVLMGKQKQINMWDMKWLENKLADKSQNVTVNGESSSNGCVFIEVPQRLVPGL